VRLEFEDASGPRTFGPFAEAVITTEVRGDGRILARYVSREQGWCFDNPEAEFFAPMTLAVGVTS
jgi:hypothetical protein